MKAALFVFGVAASIEVSGRWLDRPDWWQPARVIALLAIAALVRLHQDHLRKAVWVPLYGAIAAAERPGSWFYGFGSAMARALPTHSAARRSRCRWRRVPPGACGPPAAC